MIFSLRNTKQSGLTPWPELLLVLCLAGCGEAEVSASGRAVPRGPARRVVLVTCDTLRADHLGCYGYARPTTPNIDRLATESTLYLNAWSAAPLTMPSISSMLTGLLPDEIGTTRSNQDLMPSSVQTLAEVVRAAGIDTAAFVSNSVLCRAKLEQGDVGVQQGFEHFDDDMMPIGYAVAAPERSGQDTTRAVVRWLAERRDDEDRFFLWVHYMDPHGPYSPMSEHLAPFVRDHAGEADLPVSDGQSGLGAIPNYQAIEGQRKPGQYVDRYDAEIHAFDAELEGMLAALRARGWLEDALLLVTADHGESLGENGYWFCHGETLQRELVRVPLLVRPPRALKQRLLPESGGRRNAKVALHLDVFPTVLEALGIEDRGGRGLSLLRATLPGDRIAPQFLGSRGMPRGRLAISDGRWRLMTVGPSVPVLRDTLADPSETINVADLYPSIVASLQGRYTEFVKRGSSAQVAGDRRQLNDRQRRDMGALGYADDSATDH